MAFVYVENGREVGKVGDCCPIGYLECVLGSPRVLVQGDNF